MFILEISVIIICNCLEDKEFRIIDNYEKYGEQRNF